MAKRKRTQEELDAIRKNVVLKMYSHVGRQHAIGMGELHEAVTGEPWHNRQNDTRLLRRIITELRYDGIPICSGRDGYWVAVGKDLVDYCNDLKAHALRKLGIVANLRKRALPELMGQLKLEIEEGWDGA